MNYSATQTLAMELISKESITPKDEGCQELLGNYLSKAGFNIKFIHKDKTSNLLATHGSGHPFLLFLGHTDVVPPGDLTAWKYPPFKPTVVQEEGIKMLYGRGSSDMKGSDAAMAMAVIDFVTHNAHHKGTIGFLVTSNEEGDGKGGIKHVTDYLQSQQLIPDYCIVGEPSSAQILGDTIKIGRRGSLTALFTINGIQGHVAYPDLIKNPIHYAAMLIAKLTVPLDNGSQYFPPTSFEVTNIKAGTGAENLVPGSCFFMCNWRFNDLQTKESIEKQVENYLQELDLSKYCDVTYVLNGQPFIAKNNFLSDVISSCIQEELNITPERNTSGGTSDGRFIATLGTETIEFGLVSKTIHKVNECIAFDDLNKLKIIFEKTCSKILG